MVLKQRTVFRQRAVAQRTVFRQKAVAQRTVFRQRAVAQRTVFRHRASTKMRMRVHYLFEPLNVYFYNAEEVMYCHR